MDEGALDGALESPRPKEALVQLLTSDEPGPLGERPLRRLGPISYYSIIVASLWPSHHSTQSCGITFCETHSTWKKNDCKLTVLCACRSHSTFRTHTSSELT